MRLLSLLLLSGALLHGQQRYQNYTPSGLPPDVALDVLSLTDTNGARYECSARAQQQNSTTYTSADVLTSIVVASGVGTVTVSGTTKAPGAISIGHGLQAGYWVTVTLPLAIAGKYQVTPSFAPSPTTSFTLAMPGAANGIYTSGLSLSTFSPPTNAPVWAVQKSGFTMGGNYRRGWASDGSNAGTASAGMLYSCDDRASYFNW